ncbi:MAG: tetratricopeptide repeat protein [Fuerstiella sp.]|nr:tetratricopeptide repeat protein [Fuerstiella sp.]
MTSSKPHSSHAATEWIISPVWDCVFFLVTPLVGIALAKGLDVAPFDTTVLLIVTAVIATGHHMPGFLRTYGDPELFARYRGRLLIAPVLLAAACISFRFAGILGLDAILLVWGVWHVLMQNYGIMRIYSARKGEPSRMTSRLDWAVMLTWIVAAYLSSPAWTYVLHERLYRTGMPLTPAGVMQTLPTIAWCVAVVTSIVYLMHINGEAQRGRPTSYLKLLLLVATVLFYTLGFQITANVLVITVVIEFVHDLQYYALAWVFQRRLVEKRLGASSIMRLLFRPSLVVLLVYCGICFAYGAALTEPIAIMLHADPSIVTVLSGLLAAATIFHFYIDGFVWKVRQPRTREYLGIEGSENRASPDILAEPSPLRRSLIHAGIYGAIISVLVGAHLAAAPPTIAMYESLVQQYPTLGASHHTLGFELHKSGRNYEAIREYGQALELGVDDRDGLVNHFAIALEAVGRYEQAIALLRGTLDSDSIQNGSDRRFVVRPLLRLLATCPDERLRDPDEVERLVKLYLPDDKSARADFLEIASIARETAGQPDRAARLHQRALAEEPDVSGK